MANKKKAHIRSVSDANDSDTWMKARQTIMLVGLLPFVLFAIVALRMYEDDYRLLALERHGVQCEATVVSKREVLAHNDGRHYLGIRFFEANRIVSHVLDADYRDFEAAVVGGSVIITYLPTDLNVMQVGRVAPGQVESYAYKQLIVLFMILIGWIWGLGRVLPGFVALRAERARSRLT